MHSAFDLLLLLKLLLAIGSLVFLTVFGARYGRLTGVLLTFPILNGLALLSSPDPMRVAGTVYQLVLLNSSLFWLAITFARWPPALLPSAVVFALRLVIWTSAWVILAYLLTIFHDRTSTAMLFVLYAAFASGATLYTWQNREGKELRSVTVHRWSTWTARIVLFTMVFFCIAYVIQTAADQKWAGMASALPLPGLFALAALSVQRKEQMLAIRDTVLLGPVLVVPFNWLFGLLATCLPSGASGQILGAFALIVAWSVAFVGVLHVLPLFEQHLDGRRPFESQAK